MVVIQVSFVFIVGLSWCFVLVYVCVVCGLEIEGLYVGKQREYRLVFVCLCVFVLLVFCWCLLWC